MTPSVEQAFEQAATLQMRYYGIKTKDGAKVVRKISLLENEADKINDFKTYLYNIPPGEYLLVCRRSARDPLIEYPVNTVNAQPRGIAENKNVSDSVTKTQKKDVDPEKFGRLQAQLEYQEKQIAELQTENAQLRTIITELEAQIEDLENETEELSEPVTLTPMQQIAQQLQPVVPVLAESLVDWIKSKSNNVQAPPQPAQQPVVDLEALAEIIIRKSAEAQQQQSQGYATA